MTASAAPQAPAITRPVAGKPLRSAAADVLTTAYAVLVGAAVALWWSDETGSYLSATSLGRLAGLLGTVGLLGLVVLIARVPWLEREVGQDVLLYWHRKLAPYTLLVMGAHMVLITIGYAATTRTNVANQLWQFITSYPDMLKATVGFVLFVGAGVLSWRRLRRFMKYETWWASHLFTYVAALLVFGHQFSNGNSFITNHAVALAWRALYIGTFGALVLWRFGIPLWRSLRHDLRVAEVQRLNADVVNVILSGRRLDTMRLQGGQFLQFRFLTRDQWWQAHPYSLSARPLPDALRITVQVVGDATHQLRRIKPGTRVWMEGPYGAFTLRRAATERLALIAGGIGITPVRSLLDDLPAGSQPVVLYRVRHAKDVVLAPELDKLVADRGGVVHYLVGSRDRQPLHEHRLQQLVPDLLSRELFICGPRSLVRDASQAARRLGLPAHAIHAERFDFE
jgi:predicted ferric reductase